MNSFPFQRASQLSTAGPQTQWLVEGLWSDQAVGILGGEPKCCRSFLALHLASSVAYHQSCWRPLNSTSGATPNFACAGKGLSSPCPTSTARLLPRIISLSNSLTPLPPCPSRSWNMLSPSLAPNPPP